METQALGNHQKVRNFSFSDKAHGRSKTQMCLKKIIDFIVLSSGSRYDDGNGLLLGKEGREKKKGLGIDLNLRLGFGLESEILNNGFSACSGVGDGDGNKGCGVSVVDCNSSVDKSSSQGECDPKEEEEEEIIEEEEEERREISEITNLQEGLDGNEEEEEQSEIKAVENEDEQAEVVEVDEKGKEKCDEEEENKISLRNCKKNGYLDLLVEAARLISGNFDDDETDEEEEEEEEGKGRRVSQRIEAERERKGCGSKRNQTWMLDLYEGFEDISPVVRSKRGRNQVLPYRFRDSVLDPWKRFSKQRSSRVSTKTTKN